MKFIRKNGKVIPIRDQGSLDRVAGAAAVGVGAYQAGKGISQFSRGIVQASSHFEGAVQSVRRFGSKAMALGAASPYGQHKMAARAGVQLARSGVKRALFGSTLAGVGAALYAFSRPKKQK